MKILVSSARTSGIYDVKNVPQKNHEVTFIAIDKKNYPSREKSLHPRTIGKIPKMLSWELYPGYDIYIWIDDRFRFSTETSVDYFVNNLRDVDAMFFNHPIRKSIKDEANFIINSMKNGDQYIIDRAKGESIKEQLEFYQKDKLFVDNVLIFAGCFAYTSNLVLNREYNLMKEWYYEVMRWNIRDQISLPYLLHKFKTNYKIVPEPLLNLKILK